MTKLASLFRKLSDVEKYNVITFPTRERYETQLCKTGHNFFSLNREGRKTWNTQQVNIPENYFIQNGKFNSYITYDMILVQSRFDDQFSLAHQIKQSLDIPIIVLDHSLPPPEINTKIRDMIRSYSGNVNVFISEFSRDCWQINSQNNIVIHHGIDSNTFTPKDNIDKQKYVLTVANGFTQRKDLHFNDWLEITKNIENKIVGDNPGLSESAKDVNHLVEEYNKCSVYLNTSRTPIPMSLLEAMSCGCAVVTVKDSMMVDIINNGVNGFISNDTKELTDMINLLMGDDNLRKSIGNKARDTILHNFSEQSFIDKWNTLFKDTYEGKYQ